MEYVRRHLGAKLLLSYLVIVVVGVGVLALTSQSILPSTFNRHMGGMMNGGMMGMGGQGFGSPKVTNQLYSDYRASFNEALLYASLVAVLVAVILSIILSRSVTRPVQAMAQASERIAGGHYDERVRIAGRDELAQFSVRFNQMAQKLEQVEAMRRRLIGDVSHELRTPLTGIKGSMEGLIDGVLPASRETFEQVHAEAERLNRLVDDLQELSRVEGHAYELELRALDAATLLHTVANRLAEHAALRHISLNVDAARGIPPIRADEDRVIQVLTNLAGNALQYTPSGGQVILSAKRTSSEVQFAVRDTGIGIPPEHQAHIFDRFYRVDKSRSRQAGGGSGIGLTIARALVEAQGGRIWAESPGEGRGSTFSFTLPVAK